MKLLKLVRLECEECFPLYSTKGTNLKVPSIIIGLTSKIAQYVPSLHFQPCHLLAHKSVVFTATLWEQGNEKKGGCIFIPWRKGAPDAENLWHFLHEVYELFVKFEFAGRELPRWLVEGIAQYGAYFVFKERFPQYLPKALEYYSYHSGCSAEEYFSWNYGSLQVSKKTGNILEEVLMWSLTEHNTDKEHGCYRIALEAFASVFSGRKTPLDLISILEEGEGVDKIRAEIEKYFR